MNTVEELTKRLESIRDTSGNKPVLGVRAALALHWIEKNTHEKMDGTKFANAINAIMNGERIYRTEKNSNMTVLDHIVRGLQDGAHSTSQGNATAADSDANMQDSVDRS